MKIDRGKAIPLFADDLAFARSVQTRMREWTTNWRGAVTLGSTC